MVCITQEQIQDEETLCVVRDFSGTSQDLKVTLMVPKDMTCKQFVRDVAKRFNFESDSLKLVSPSLCKKNNVFQAVLTENSEELLKDVGVNFDTGSRNLFIVEGLNGRNPRLVNSQDDDLDLGASASPEEPPSNSYSSIMPPSLSDEMEESYNDKIKARLRNAGHRIILPSPLLDEIESDNDGNLEASDNPNRTRNVNQVVRFKPGRSELDNLSFNVSPYSIVLLSSPRVADIAIQKRFQEVPISHVYCKFVMPERCRVLCYRGLVNQAMTCYLNSLLQALFMTPEFRNAVYNWNFEPDSGVDEAKSIPYQLQKLFLNLQTSSRVAVETTELTRSFGWDSSEAWQQHDIQELCRVMFDALEQEFKGTEQSDLINRLYQGKMIDYVKCLECGNAKSREDTFLDIPLPVRPFGSTVAYGSVEEALRAFVKPETLDGNNQYFCEQCDKKCNAHKGLKFSKFPYLLTLHLMRFDFDYNTMHRIKLSDKVVFPETLNLNSFISFTSVSSTMYKEEGSEGFPEEITGSSSKCDDSSTTDSGSAIDDESCLASSNDLNNVDYEQDVDEGIDVGNQHDNDKSRNHSMDAGPYVYELFSIMVHSGSASGGHYYVYIKDFCTGDWFCFNDQTVTRITNKDIDRSFGGYGPSAGYYSGVYSSSMNAYMLMYRQIDTDRNVLPLKEKEFPPHIKVLLQKIDEKAEYDRKMREKEKEMCRLKVHVQHPTMLTMLEYKIDCNASTTLRELTQIAYNKLQLENYAFLDLCRLVLYNSQTDSIENSLEGRENDEIGIILNPLFNVKKSEMLMEIRQRDTPFPVYKPGSVSLKLYQVNLDQEQIENPVVIRTSIHNLLPEFRDELYERFKHQRSFELFIVVETKGNTERFLGDETLSLRDLGIVSNSKIFVCFKKTDTSTKCRIKLRSLVQRFLNTIKLNIMLPDIKSEVFKRLSIPTLAEYTNSKNQKFEEETPTISSTVKEPLHINISNADVSTSTNTHNGNNLLLPAMLNAPPLNAEDTYSNEVVNQCLSAVTGGQCSSDQSASEDSSLTDSERTIIGETEEDDRMSSSGTSPRGCDNAASPEKSFAKDNRNSDKFTAKDIEKSLMKDDRKKLNANDTDFLHSMFSSASEENCGDNWNKQNEEFYDDSTNEVNSEYYFKEISNNVSIDRKKNGMVSDLKVEIDKRMPINTFKKYLEQYVQASSPYFKLCTGDTEWPPDINVKLLKHLEDDTTLHVRLGRPRKPGTLKGKVYHLNFKATKVVKSLDEFNIDEECTVAETKKQMLDDFRILLNFDMSFEKCRIRKKTCEGPSQICLNEQKWKDLNLGDNWELFLQELDAEEPLTNTGKQTCVIVRQYHPSTGNLSPFQEITVEELTIGELKTKISKISNIPVEHLVLGDQQWSTAICLSNYGINIDTNWSTMTDCTQLDEWPINLREDGHLINYKDSREESANENAGMKYRNHLFLPKREGSSQKKGLTIQVRSISRKS